MVGRSLSNKLDIPDWLGAVDFVPDLAWNGEKLGLCASPFGHGIVAIVMIALVWSIRLLIDRLVALFAGCRARVGRALGV